MKRIRKGDTVVVTSGREKGRTGTVVGVQADGRKVRFFKSNGEQLGA